MSKQRTCGNCKFQKDPPFWVVENEMPEYGKIDCGDGDTHYKDDTGCTLHKFKEER